MSKANRSRARGAKPTGLQQIWSLVVILIIGVLAAIALPAFLNQRSKAQDSEAKSGARTVQTALETVFTDTQSYATGTVARLTEIEPAIGQLLARVTVPTATADTYVVRVASKKANGNTWIISREDDGNVKRTCEAASAGECPPVDAATGSS